MARYLTSETMHKCDGCALVCAKREMKHQSFIGHYYSCPRCDYIATELQYVDVMGAMLNA